MELRGRGRASIVGLLLLMTNVCWPAFFAFDQDWNEHLGIKWMVGLGGACKWSGGSLFGEAWPNSVACIPRRPSLSIENLNSFEQSVEVVRWLSSIIWNASLFTIFVPLSPPPNQQSDGFPLEFYYKDLQQSCEHSAKSENKLSQNCEQTEL